MTTEMEVEFDWTETLAWLQEHPTATPGGWGEPDLFDVPLPPGFPQPEGEWAGGPHWGEQDEPPGIQWSIGDTGYSIVFPAGGDPYIRDPEGWIIR